MKTKQPPEAPPFRPVVTGRRFKYLEYDVLSVAGPDGARKKITNVVREGDPEYAPVLRLLEQNESLRRENESLRAELEKRGRK